MSKIKVLEWNIKGSAALPWNKPYEIKKELVDKVLNQEADIIVLVEFCIGSGWDFFEKRLREEKYIFFMNCLTGKNGILICIKSDLIRNKYSLKNSVYNNFEQTVFSRFGDYSLLGISFRLNDGRQATVMGLRIETNLNNSSFEEYNRRRKVFEEFLKTLKSPFTNEICIVAGDFNNAQCHGDLHKKYDPNDYDDKDGKEMAQINYNLNIIRDEFDDLGFKMLDIDDNGRSIPTWIKYGKIPDDHIFVRGLALQDKVCKPVCKPVEVDNLSDHKALLATFSIDAG